MELASAHKNVTTTVSILHITIELVNTPKINLTALIYSLVNGLYNITTESINFMLDVEQFGMGSNFIDVHKVSYFFFFIYTFLLRHSMDSIELPLSIFQPKIHHEV